MFLSYAQNGEDVMLWRALRSVPEGFYIDVGACDPQLDSVTLAFYEGGWRGINIEPTQEDFLRLQKHRPADQNLSVAVGATAGEITFYRIPDTGLSTTDAAQAREHREAGWPVETRHVPAMTLAEICRRHAARTIHFLKIDCEGSEGDVLKGADFTAFRPWIILIEATRPNSQVKTHDAWEPFLVAADYRFVWFDGLNRFYLAAEHCERLQRHFEIPLSVFDNYKKVAPPPPPCPEPASDMFEAAKAEGVDAEQRIAITARCRDADPIPKVDGAGTVRTQEDGERIQIMHNGLKVPAGGYYGDWMMRLIELCRGHHEPQEERLFDAIVRRLPANATMIELGGFWAYYSAWFLMDAPQRRAVVLEPDPAHRAVGERTMALNSLHAEFVAGFVGPTPQGPTLFRTEQSGDILLPRQSVPKMMEDHKIEVLDVLHCDTQGAELGVLESCRDLFSQGRIHWVIVSTHACQITGDPLMHQRCLVLLQECGASIEAEHDVHESFSGDGLIVARFCPAPDDWHPIQLSINRYSESMFRNPLYDLARELHKGPHRDTVEKVVNALYQTLFLRQPEPWEVKVHTNVTMGSWDFVTLLRNFLLSHEFRVRRPDFSQRYFDLTPRMSAASTFFATKGALCCSSLSFSLTQDCPLGKQGDRLIVPFDSVLLPAVFEHGAWNAEHIAFVMKRLDRSASYALVDIGANIGLFSRQLLHASAPIQAVHCAEPDPENFRALTENLAPYGDRNLHLSNVALGLNDGEATFYRDTENIGNYSLNQDAMRDRPFEVARVRVVAARDWLETSLSAAERIIWKSDTQGHDEVIVGQVPWEIWNRVQVAVIELWRIDKAGLDRGDFLAKIESFPNRRLGDDRAATTADVEAYLSSSDWQHTDLFLWR